MDRLMESPCAAFNVRRAARIISQVYDRFLAPCGLKVSQYSLMKTLVRMGPRSVQALARDMGVDRTTLGRNVRPLERDGLVSIEINDKDRRGRRLALTPMGRAKLVEAEPLWLSAQANFEAAFGREEMSALLVTMHSVASLSLNQ